MLVIWRLSIYVKKYFPDHLHTNDVPLNIDGPAGELRLAACLIVGGDHAASERLLQLGNESSNRLLDEGAL